MGVILSKISISFIIPVIFGIALIAIIIHAVFFNDKKKIERILSQIPYTSINNIQTNKFTKVKGKTQALDTTLISPFSKKPCVFYSLKIQEEETTGKNDYWTTIIEEEKIISHLIDKDGDKLIVVANNTPKNYKNYVKATHQASFSFKAYTKESKNLESLLDSYGINKKNTFNFNDKKYRCIEAIIEINEEVIVAGIAKWKNLETSIPNYSYSKIGSLQSTDEQEIIITNTIYN